MKKIIYTLCAGLALLSFFSCEKKDEGTKVISFTAQLTCDGNPLQVKDATISIFDANLTEYRHTSDSLGQALASLPAGLYTWSASGQVSKTDSLIKYNGASTTPFEVKEGMDKVVNFPVNKVVATSSIIIKEAYVGGYTNSEGKSVIMTDAYIILYNNSAIDADASDIVFTFAAPYNGEASNAYYGTDGKLLYENENWIPAYGAIWWFKSPVTLPAYSQIVVACFGAIDHTQTDAGSVDLSKAGYYWMSNVGVTQYTNKNYTCSENIPETNHLTCSPFTQGTSWALSTLSPALYIGKMKAAEAEKISQDSENYDHTLGSKASANVVKFPKANVVDALEVFTEAKVESSKVRFPAAINTGYCALTNKLGHTLYRNVDKAATEALAENEGLLVTGYAADPSGIDAEASIKKGAHIIYMDTNSSTNDFHQREIASLK